MVLQYGASDRQGFRGDQEDRVVLIPALRLAAVFDGHGGSLVSQALQNEFNSLKKVDANLVLSTLEAVQNRVEKDLNKGGSTATIAFVDDSAKKAHVFWCGDGSCFAINETGVARGTVVEMDHAANMLMGTSDQTVLKNAKLQTRAHSIPGLLIKRTTPVPPRLQQMSLFSKTLNGIVQDATVENDDRDEHSLKEFMMMFLYNGDERMRWYKDQKQYWIRPHGRSKEKRAIVGWIEPTRSIGDVTYPLQPIPLCSQMVWNVNRCYGIVVTCDGFFSNGAFKSNDDLAKFLLDPSTFWKSTAQVQKMRKDQLNEIAKRESRKESKYTRRTIPWEQEVNQCADDVLDVFFNESTIDPRINILDNPMMTCKIATATAILKASQDNCTIAWIPISLKSDRN